MADYTSVRLSHGTRDSLNDLARELGVTADRAIAAGIQAIRDERWRRQAEEHALRIARDPADRAEVAAALHDLGDDE